MEGSVISRISLQVCEKHKARAMEDAKQYAERVERDRKNFDDLNKSINQEAK